GGRHVVDLGEKGGDHALQFAHVGGVAALFADGVELVEEEHARVSARMIEYAAKACRGFAEIAANERVVFDRVERQRKRGGDGFGQACFANAWRAYKQHGVARLYAV